MSVCMTVYSSLASVMLEDGEGGREGNLCSRSTRSSRPSVQLTALLMFADRPLHQRTRTEPGTSPCRIFLLSCPTLASSFPAQADTLHNSSRQGWTRAWREIRHVAPSRRTVSSSTSSLFPHLPEFLLRTPSQQHSPSPTHTHTTLQPKPKLNFFRMSFANALFVPVPGQRAFDVFPSLRQDEARDRYEAEQKRSRQVAALQEAESEDTIVAACMGLLDAYFSIRTMVRLSTSG